MTPTALDRLWTPADYSIDYQVPNALDDSVTDTVRLGLTGTGAMKLADSAVAPLVAAARGYLGVDSRNFADMSKRLGITRANSAQGSQLQSASHNGGCLVLPWYSLRDAGPYEQPGAGERPFSAIQLRPANPSAGPNGKIRKYVFLYENKTVLDMHPAIPSSWLSDAPRMAFIEGNIKADSALTAFLLDAGISMEDLAWVDDSQKPGAARAALRAICEQIDPIDAIAIVAIGGVGNWRKNDEWRSFNLAGREAWVGFDGDVALKFPVWSQAEDIFEQIKAKGGVPKLIDLSEIPTDDGSKVGIDDYLATGATWADVPALLTTTLPPRPEADIETHVGAWRVNEADGTVEECVTVMDGDGRSAGAAWERRCGIAAQVRVIETARTPTADEEADGQFDPKANSTEESRTEIDIFWSDPTTNVMTTATVTGPATILAEMPQEWARRRATVPASVLGHPDWPPAKGADWLRTIKAHKHDEVEARTSWARMGWVPVPDGTPVYIVGDQVVGPDGLCEDLATPGVTDGVLSGASSFGVQFPTVGGDARRAIIRNAITDVIRYYAIERTWTGRGVGATVLAAMLRPTCPTPTSVSIYITGSKGGGKSFMASMMMSGWQPRPGRWNENNLPGAAKDTMAATEHAVARTPIWVADDLAPSTDYASATAETAKLGDLVRAVHNKAGKRRMTRDMTSRSVPNPHALFVITAENEHPISSVRDRAIMINLPGRSAMGDEALVSEIKRMRDFTGETGIVVGAILEYLAGKFVTEGFATVQKQLDDLHQDNLARVLEQYRKGGADEGAAARHSMIAADLMRGLDAVSQLGAEYGVDHAVLAALDEMKGDIADLIAEQHKNRHESSPGASVLEAVAAVLKAGKGHLASATTPSVAPFNGNGDMVKNMLVGWRPSGSDGTLSPRGDMLGLIVSSADGIDDVVLLDARVAFNEAAKHYRELIPHGSTLKSAWSSAGDEGLLTTLRLKGGAPARPGTNSVRVRSKGVHVSGVPVLLDALISNGSSEDGDGDGYDD